jgi:DNA-binding PadR family transcriptional regulator
MDMSNRRFFDRHFEHHSRRLFEKGDLKYVILDLLKDRACHGYEIIRRLEERFHGFYTPSAGSVYPTLQLLEDMGYVSASERDGKKVYTITDAGMRFLTEREDVVENIKDNMRDWCGANSYEEFGEAMHEFGRLGHLIGKRAHRLAPGKLAQIKEVVSRACDEIEEIIGK